MTDDSRRGTTCTRADCECGGTSTVHARIDRSGDPFLGAATAELDEEIF